MYLTISLECPIPVCRVKYILSESLDRKGFSALKEQKKSGRPLFQDSRTVWGKFREVAKINDGKGYERRDFYRLGKTSKHRVDHCFERQPSRAFPQCQQIGHFPLGLALCYIHIQP